MPPVVRALLVLALVGGAACAQSFPALARVKVNAASVRGTAGDLSPETAKLELGTRVTVLSAEGNDWLAIQPPAGSISWIPWTLVEPQAKPGPDGKLAPPFNAVVTPDDGAAIRPGAVGESKPLGVQKTKLPKGTIVQVVGPRVKVKADGEEQEANWYPIIAPKDDVRFIRRDAVEWAGAAPPASFVVKAGGSSSKPLPGTTVDPGSPSASKGDFTLNIPNGDRPQFPTTPNAQKPADWPNNYPLWREAEKARGAGETKLARELYTKLAQEVSREGTVQDLDLANLCYDRVYNSLGNGGSGSGSGNGGSAWRPPEATPGRATAPAPSVKADPPKAEKAGPTVEGTLHSANAKLDGKWTIYLLADEKRVIRHYVISGGVDLDKFVGKWVEVSGNEIRPDSLRGDPVIVATEVKPK